MQKLKSTSSSMLCSSWLFHTNDRKNCVHFDLNEQSKRNIYFKYSYATNEHNERKSEKNSVLSPLRPLSPPFYYSSNKQLLMSIFVLNSCAENGHGHPFFHSFRTMISIAHNVGKKCSIYTLAEASFWKSQNMNGQFKGECECVSASCYIKQWYSKKREMQSGKYNERWRWHLSHRARPHKAYIFSLLKPI